MLKHPIYNIANLLTCLNLLSGCLAIVSLHQGLFNQVIYFVFFSLVMDFLDGMVARKMGTGGVVGKDLDSLADVVSFGILPATMIYQMFFFNTSEGILTPEIKNVNSSLYFYLIQAVPFILSVFAALRLAKFNNDIRQTNDFYGLNTPTCTLFVLGIFQTWISNQYNLINLFSEHYIICFGLVVVLSILMMSDIRMFSFKLKGFDMKTHWNLPAMLVFSIISILLFGYLGISIAVIGYILISLVYFKTSKTI